MDTAQERRESDARATQEQRESNARATLLLKRLEEEELDTAMMGSALTGDAAQERRSRSSAPLGGVLQATRRESNVVAQVSLSEVQADAWRESNAVVQATLLEASLR